MAEQVKVDCPCCGNRMVVDAATGDVLSEDRPKTAKSFEDALGEVRSGAARREERFEQAASRTRRSEDLLQKKFDEAMKKSKHDDRPPVNPLDLD